MTPLRRDDPPSGLTRGGDGLGAIAPTSMQLLVVSYDDPRVRPVLAGLGEEYRQRYGEMDELARAEACEFDPPSGIFYVLQAAQITVAGGGYRRLGDDACEVKRLWTSADRRRMGLAGFVLDALETSARQAGYRIVRLETGPRQPEAVAFYTTRGYRPIPLYSDRYEHALAFERSLA